MQIYKNFQLKCLLTAQIGIMGVAVDFRKKLLNFLNIMESTLNKIIHIDQEVKFI